MVGIYRRTRLGASTPACHLELPARQFQLRLLQQSEARQLLTAALKTTDRAEKTKIYDEAQELIWKDAPWVFLVVDQGISARSANLTGFYSLKDGGFNFLEADLK